MSGPAITLALCAAADPAVALCAALPIPAGTGDGPPEWIHLLPAGEIATMDGRGPYRVADAAALIAASVGAGDRLPLDENHATDLAAPQGQPAPARGWITALQSRADGIWGQVDWTAAGRRLVSGKSYRHISPVIAHRADGTVTGVLRASLVNRPNLRGLAALHQQDDLMDFMTKLREALGLGKDADEGSILDRAKSSTSAVAAHAAQLAPIAKAAGLAETADGTAVLQAVQSLADPAKTVPAQTVVALQAELATLGTQLKTVTDTAARERATTYVDGLIRDRTVGVVPLRDHYIAQHMVDPARVEKELGALPKLAASGGITSAPPPGSDGKVVIDDEERRLTALMGIDPEAYRKTKEAFASQEEAL